MNNNKIIVINGTTSSGKTGLAVKLAYKYNGEIISSDSRQVYKGMDIGTGKDLKEYWVKKKMVSRRATGSPPQSSDGAGCRFAPRNDKVLIPYYLIDVVSPKTEYNLGKFKRKADKVIKDILRRGKVPIIAGGTGLWTQAIVDNFNLSSVKEDKKLRERLEKISVEKLFLKLKKIDKGFAEGLHESDRKNKRRLIRYIEIGLVEKHTPSSLWLATPLKRGFVHSAFQEGNDYEYLLLGLKWPKDVLEKRIYKRLLDRIKKEGMIDEVKRLHFKMQVSWKRLISFGLEYKYVSMYLRGELEYDEMVEKLFIAIRQFAKKQRSWYRRWEKQGAKIYWLQKYGEADRRVKEFLK